MREILWTSGTALIGALVLTPIIRDIFHAYNVVDRPGLRKIHAHPVPRLGGLAIALAYIIALAWAPHRTSADSGVDALLWKLLPGAITILLTGIFDDFFNLPAAYKLGGQVAAAAIAFGSGLRVEAIGGVPLPLAVSLPVTVLWLLVAMNAFNLIDGLDGLCAGVGFVGAAAMYAVARVQGNAQLEQIVLPLTGALLGFLWYNFSRATMFLGDSGALLIGFLIGCSGILYGGQETQLSATVPLMAIAVPLMDLSLSVVRRFLGRRPIFSADRGHIHHRLLDRGFTSRGAVVILYAWAAVGAIFAFLVGHPSWQRWQPFLTLGFCVTAWMGVRELRYSEFKVAAKLFFRTELRGAIKGGDRIRELTAALERSTTEDEWWDLLTAAGREAGWVNLLWVRDHSVWREQRFPSPAPPSWSYSLSLSDRESLQIDGTLPPAPSSIDILAFAAAVHSAFAARRPAWDRSALS